MDSRRRTRHSLGELSFALTALLALSLHAGPVRAQGDVMVPNQMHKSLTFELHSVDDHVTMYEGDPQFLLRLDLRPERTTPPKVDFSIANQAATLRIRDLSLLDLPRELTPEEAADPDMPRPDLSPRTPVAQDWTVEVMPSSPTDFVIQCDGGKGEFDFTDLPVRSVHCLADTTEVKVNFDRPNSVALDRFKLTVRYGSVKVVSFLNARARSTTFQVDGSKFELDLSGEPPGGDSDVFVEGEPTEMRIAISRQIGLHLEGPAAMVAHFDREGLVRQGQGLESSDFDSRPRRVKLYLARNAPKVKVQWTD